VALDSLVKKIRREERTHTVELKRVVIMKEGAEDYEERMMEGRWKAL
jgi:hypothetical protein